MSVQNKASTTENFLFHNRQVYCDRINPQNKKHLVTLNERKHRADSGCMQMNWHTKACQMSLSWVNTTPRTFSLGFFTFQTPVGILQEKS